MLISMVKYIVLHSCILQLHLAFASLHSINSIEKFTTAKWFHSISNLLLYSYSTTSCICISAAL